MASPTVWTRVWVSSGSWWWTGKPGVLWFMGLQRVGHDWATELNWTKSFVVFFFFFWPFYSLWDVSSLTRPGIEPLLPEMEVWSPNHWMAREVPPRNYFVCSLPGSNSLIMIVLLDCSNSILSSGSISNSSYLAISTTSAIISSTEVLNPSKSSMRVLLIFLTFFHES